MTMTKKSTKPFTIEGKEVLQEFDLPAVSIEELEELKKQINDLPVKIQELFKQEQVALVSRYKGYLQALATVNGVSKEDLVHYEGGKLYLLQS